LRTNRLGRARGDSDPESLGEPLLGEPHEAPQRGDVAAFEAACDDALALVAAQHVLEVRARQLRRIVDRFGWFRQGQHLLLRLLHLLLHGATFTKLVEKRALGAARGARTDDSDHVCVARCPDH